MDLKFMEWAIFVPLFNVCQKDSSLILAISERTYHTPLLSYHCICSQLLVLSQPILPCREVRKGTEARSS